METPEDNGEGMNGPDPIEGDARTGRRVLSGIGGVYGGGGDGIDAISSVTNMSLQAMILEHVLVTKWEYASNLNLAYLPCLYFLSYPSAKWKESSDASSQLVQIAPTDVDCRFATTLRQKKRDWGRRCSLGKTWD